MANDEAGIAALGARLLALLPTVSGLAATGGDPRAVGAALAAAGLPVAGVHPRPARACATASGPLATTEALDARALAPCAEAVRPPPRPLADAPADDLRALWARRRHLGARRTAEQHRLGRAPSRLRPDLQAPITRLHARLARLADDLDPTRRARPVWRAREERLRRLPGRGPVGTRTLLLDLPAWGTLSRQRLAALVGGAPLTRDRGPRRGRRTSWGGRAHVRATLSMRTLGAVRSHAVLKVFSERWRAVGKSAKVALTACRRKLLTILHAMRKHHAPWQVQEGPNAEQTRPP